jgi:hypothetical protein
MRGGRIRNPLELTLMVASVLLALAVALWLFAIIVSWWSDCPASGSWPTGLDKGISLWPPGADCYPAPLTEGGRWYGSNDMVVYELAPLLKWVILGLGVTALGTLTVGLGASINSLRSRPEAEAG